MINIGSLHTIEENNYAPIQSISPDVNKHITLSEFLSPLVHAVRLVSHSKWVAAEISSISGTSHLYLDLIESNENGAKIAQLRAVIWANSKSQLISRFKDDTGGETLRKGLKVLLKLKPALSPQYGLSASIEDIDPAFTLGEAAAKLIALRKRLIDENKYNVQAQMIQPAEFTSVVVICPASAAGLGDFKSQADPIQKAGLCHFTYYFATFQGDKTSTEIIDALRKVYVEYKNVQFDCLIILRGGGSQADLAWLNNYEIASAISKMPLPVFVAVGHERDTTILDEIANCSFHTPSKAIAHIIRTIESNAKNALEAFQIIINAAQNSVSMASQLIEQFRSSLISASDHQIKRVDQTILNAQQNTTIVSYHMIERSFFELDRNLSHIQTNAFLCISTITEQAKSDAEFVIGVGPKKTLERGFAIARTLKGKSITRKKDAIPGETISLQFSDGNVDTRVI